MLVPGFLLVIAVSIFHQFNQHFLTALFVKTYQTGGGHKVCRIELHIVPCD